MRQALLQIGAAFLLQIGASVITKWGSLIITNQGRFYHKSGQLLQIGAIITNWGIIDVNMLVKICACGVDSTLNLKSKITFVNNDLSIGDFLKMTKQDDGSKRHYTL